MTEGRGARWLAWGLWALAMLLCVVGFLLLYETRDVPVGEVYGARGASGIIAIPFATMGALLAARRGRNPIGWLFLAAALCMGFVVFGEEYATYSFARRGSSLPLTDPIAWLQNWMWVPLVAFGLVYPFLLFPHGKLPSKRWRWLAWLAPPAMLAFGLALASAPGQLQSVADGFVNPYGVSEETAEGLLSILGLPFIGVAVLSIVAMAKRFRRSTGDDREQIKWLLFAGGLTTLFLLLNLVLGITGGEGLIWQINAILTQASIGGIAVAAGVAVLKYRLYNIDVVINRTLVFGALAVFITAVYVSVVAGIGAAVGSGPTPNLGLSILGTAIVAVAFQPVRHRAHRLANRLVYGRRATSEEILSELGSGIASAYSIEEALPRLARLVVDATLAERAAVWLAVGPELRRASSWPDDEHGPSSVPLAGDAPAELPGADRIYPVRHQGELLGALAVSLRPGETIPPGDERLLTDIASHAGLVLRNVRLVAELRASRQRLVAAQDLERRRIERNLHDGAQQQLVALSVKARLAEAVADRDPGQHRQLLAQLRSDATEALENLRELAHGIYPPVLADRGLVAALETQAKKSPVSVELRSGGIGRYAQELEAAVYFCVLEALQNVTKYAKASSARVDLADRDGGVVFTVTDDGAGFDPRVIARGAGLTNMTDRIEALGGGLEVRSQPGAGTTVSGWVPGAASGDV